LVDLGLDGKAILEWILLKECGSMWPGLIWLRNGTIGKILFTFRLHKMPGIFD